MESSNGGHGRKRLSLFAASSAAAVSMVGAAGVALVPNAARAADECGPPAGAQTCSGTFSSINYPLTTGNLTLTLVNGVAVTTGGLSVTGSGANTVLINRSDTPAGTGDPSITNTSGAGIQATTGTGALTLTLTDGDVAGGDAPLAITGTTAGVRLQSGATTGTAINLTFTNGSIAATGANGIGVEATTTSVAAGLTTLNLGGSVTGATGVQATSNGTVGMTVNVTAVSGTVLGGDIVGTNGPAIRLSPGAISSVTVGAGRTVRASNAGGAVIEVTNINATRSASFTNNGVVRSNDETEAGYDDLVIRVGGGAGNSTVTNGNSGVLQGRVSLLNTGTATVAVGQGVWHTAGANTFGEGASAGSLTSSNGRFTAEAGTIFTNAGGAPTSFSFGDGQDTFNNGGTLAVGEGDEAAATLVITGLETWNNSGKVLFGVHPDFVTSYGRPTETDGAANDRIEAQGAAFLGTTSGFGASATSSNFSMDVDFSADQLNCAAAITADCLDLRGGSATGSTPIDVSIAGTGFGQRLVLIDAGGAGTSEATAFHLASASDGYRELAGGTAALEGGVYLYTLEFDDTAKQYALVASEFGGASLEVARMGRAATEPWRTAVGTWHDRQMDLRDAVAAGEAAPGVWLKLAGNFIDEARFDVSAAGLEYETSADQTTTALVGGVDLVRRVGGDAALVLGVTAGQLDSNLDFTAAPGEVAMNGHSFGVYGTLVSGPLFIDAIVNRTNLDLEFREMGGRFATSATSTGLQLEGGYRAFQFSDGGAYVEPLAALTYVKTDLDDLAFGTANARFDTESLRAALGVRVAGDVGLEALTARFSFTGRVWQEFEGENRTVLAATFANAALVDEAPETLADLGVALGLFSIGHRVSANLGYGVTFADDYQSTDASLSVRINW